MDRVYNNSSQNSYRALVRREMGLSSGSIKSLLARRVFSNVAQDKHADVTSEVHQTAIYRLQVHYPFVLTWGDAAIKLWHLETGKCQWVKNIADFKQWYGVELLEERILCTGKLAPPAHASIQILHRDTGERIAQYFHPRLSKGTFLSGKSRDYFVAWKKQIERYSLDTGKRIEAIDTEEFIDEWSPLRKAHQFPSRLASSKECLIHLFQGGLAIHYLNKKEKDQITFNFAGREILDVFFDGIHCFCGTRLKQGANNLLDCHLLDLDKKKVALIHQVASPGMVSWKMSAAFHKQQAYLGYLSGHLTAVNWVNHTSVELSSPSTDPINFLNLQEGLLISGSHPQGMDTRRSGTLKFWDIHSLTSIGQTDWPAPWVTPSFSFGKLVLMNGSKLEVRDYSRGVETDSALQSPASKSKEAKEV